MTRAFGQTWKVVGILLTAMSVYAFVVRVWGISLSDLVQAIVGAYQALFHPLIAAAFGWLHIELSPFAKDMVMIWFAVGASLARTFYDLFETGAGKTPAKWSRPLLGAWDASVFNNPILRSLCLAICVLIWPLGLMLLLSKPRVCVSTGGRKFALIGDRDAIPQWNGQQHYAVKHDLRIVFAMYLGAVIGCVIGLVIVNLISN
jgi:hypothetical protein